MCVEAFAYAAITVGLKYSLAGEGISRAIVVEHEPKSFRLAHI
jgi:hypothetical protein